MNGSAPVPWRGFSHDPRLPGNAGLRASDQDRDVILRLLSEAYADGRLDRQEYDERAEAATRAKTLGDLPPLVADLVPEPPGAGSELVLASPEELRVKAVARYRSSRRHAFSGMVVPTVVTFVIWFAVGWHDGSWDPGFPWPVFVALGTGINLLRVLLNKQDIVEEEQRRLGRRQQEALEPSRRDDES